MKRMIEYLIAGTISSLLIPMMAFISWGTVAFTTWDFSNYEMLFDGVFWRAGLIVGCITMIGYRLLGGKNEKND